MSSRAEAILKSNALVTMSATDENVKNLGTYRSRVDCDAIVLIVHLRTINDHIVATSNIKTIGVMAERSRITGGVVDSHAGDGEAIAAIDANSLDRSVLDVQIGDRGRSQGVGGKELRLRLAAVTALSVPPTRTIGIENRS